MAGEHPHDHPSPADQAESTSTIEMSKPLQPGVSLDDVDEDPEPMTLEDDGQDAFDATWGDAVWTGEGPARTSPGGQEPPA